MFRGDNEILPERSRADMDSIPPGPYLVIGELGALLAMAGLNEREVRGTDKEIISFLGLEFLGYLTD